jgi:PAS domain S-box-containing protein
MENPLGHQQQVEEEPEQLSFDLEELPEPAKRLIQELRENQAVLERQNQQLRRSEFYYQALVEYQLELICRTSPEGNLTFVNEAYCRYFGKSREELLGSNFLDLIPPEEQFPILCRRIDFTPGNPTLVAEHHVLDAQGRLRWNRWTTQAFFDAEGELIGFQSVGSDITEQKQAVDRAEEVLRQGKEHYALAQQAANVGSWERELATGKLYWSEQTEAIFGFAPGEFPGTYEAFLDCVHPEDRGATVEAAQNSLFQGREYSCEHRIIRRDGAVCWVLERGNAVRDEQGRPLRFTGIVQDITEHKQADKALQQAHEQERYLRQVADSLREVLTILNSSLALEEVLVQIFAQLSRVIRYEGGAIFWPEGEDLLLSQAVGSVAQGHQGEHIPINSSNPVARVFRNKQPLVINKGSQEPYWMDWSHKQLIYAWIGMPLKVDQEIIGVLTLDRYQPDDPFPPEDVQILQAFANQAALAIRNARLYEALQASEIRFRAISELISDYAYSVRVEPDQTMILEWFTSAFTQITGHTFEGVEGPLYKLVVYPEDLPLVQQHLQKLLTNQEDVTEYRIVTTTGDIRWVRDYGRPVWGEFENRVVRFINAAQDITERRQAEQALSEREKQYRLLAEHSYDAVALFEGGRVTYASPAYEHIYGQPVDQIIGLDYQRILVRIHPDDREYVLSQMRRPEPVLKYSFRVKHQEGHYIWVEDVVKRTLDEQGKPIRTIINTRDITERKQLEEQLYHAQKMDALGRLAGGVAHHFNNLLTAIIGFIELGMINLPPYHPAVEDLNQAHTTSLRAATLTHQLIAFTRRQMVHPKLFNLNDLVKRGEALLARLIPVSVTFTTDLAPQVGSIKIDESQFEQFLVNLVINACEAMAEGGRLTLQTANVMVSPAEAVALSNLSPGPYVRLTVSDTGVGISEDIQTRIFEPFFTTKDVGQGVGLGLSTCYGIVKQHGGEITVESRSGQGATFHVYFPQVEGEL